MAGKGILEAEKSTQTTGGSKLFHTPGPAASADFRKLLYMFRLLLVEVGDPILVLQHNWRKAEGGGRFLALGLGFGAFFRAFGKQEFRVQGPGLGFIEGFRTSRPHRKVYGLCVSFERRSGV